MDASFNFNLLNEQPLSKLCLNKHLTHFESVCQYIKQLPYGRNANKTQLSLVMSEEKGTCSTKHAFLAQIARENGFSGIILYIGIYSMNNINTPGIGTILQNHNLDYIPEAHTYLKYNSAILDYTSNKPSTFKKHLLYEEEILPEQIADHKVNLHQSYVKNWIIENAIPYSFEKIWKIREQCIANLSS